ncbi:hypothetical protein MCECIE61_00633 [Candidatus Methylopumilus planktonicus]|uniref:hypothetical protein n=1 Tax=Candidatus Methylopumilus planktonicus TaxID=1581557 RepID=UPI003BEEB7B3
MNISDCPKYEKCSAPICPLDKDWKIRVLCIEDSTCFYLLESVKDTSTTHFELAQLGVLHERICEVRDDICTTHKRISNKVKAAKNSGSRMARKFTHG